MAGVGLGESVNISLEPIEYEIVRPEDVILAQQQQSQSSVTTALTDAQIKPAVIAITPDAIYASLDNMAKYHKRPMSDKEYFYLVDILKKNGFTSDKLYQLHDLFATAVAVLTNYYAFKRPEELDPIVEQYVNSIKDLPSYSLSSFNKSLEHFYTGDWFGRPVKEARNLYSKEERLIFGSLGIAFMDEYAEQQQIRRQAQDIYDSGTAQRTEDYVALATGSIIQTMAPAVEEAAALVEKATKEAKPYPKGVRALSFEEKVHPMLRYGLVTKRN